MPKTPGRAIEPEAIDVRGEEITPVRPWGEMMTNLARGQASEGGFSGGDRGNSRVESDSRGQVPALQLKAMRSTLQRREDPTGEGGKNTTEGRSNRTGLPDALKTGIENLSGYSLDDVRVHYNSPKPAELQALAYTQGTDIHVAPGQEKHLPHEAWHVVQQKQGRVKPTLQMKGKININDDAGLEKEADVMGEMANRNTGEVVTNGVKKENLSRKELVSEGLIQMAGHAGVMIFGNEGRLFKRVERNEHDQFRTIMNRQAAERLGHGNSTYGAFPRIYRVISALELNPELIKQEYGDTKKVREWLKNGKQGDYYVEMESLGGQNIDVLDFKIGTATADYEELTGNYGKTDREARKKVAKMAKIDTTTESATMGLRDSDVAKASIKDNIKRILMGKFVPTLTDITKRIQKDHEEGRRYVSESQAIVDLNNIRDYITNADTVYIASSLVMKWNKDRTRMNLDRVVLIDLAHPMNHEMRGFPEVKQGMLRGIENLRGILLGGV